MRYLFIGKSGAIILGYPDTTQDAHLFPERSPANGAALVKALREVSSNVRILERERDDRHGLSAEAALRRPDGEAGVLRRLAEGEL